MTTIISSREAASLVDDNDVLLVNPTPVEELLGALEARFVETAAPRDLTVVWSAGLGPFSEASRGMNHVAHKGLVKRLIGGHFGLNYRLIKLIADEEVEAYNLPQGVLPQLYREIAAKRPGLLSPVGVGTFVDPRLEGGKLNERTRRCEDLMEIVVVEGREYLRYKPFHIDVAFIRGTSADPMGNIVADDEAMTMEILEVAMAAKSCGGKVIAQVMSLSDAPAHPHHVKVPGIFVDHVVVASSRQTHPHSLFVDYDPSYSGAARVNLEQEFKPMPLGAEKVISRRAALELSSGMNVNLGVGIPMGVATVAFEEGFLDRITLNNELGAIGGLPEGGKNFGPAKNPSAFISQAAMFDFYDGGGLDVTCVGLAQADREGNVNVSKIGTRIIGCGGFINITQAARTCVFCGEFTACGLDTAVEKGRLVIRHEGTTRKFIEAVQQITFSGKVARAKGQRVLFVTERCVFRLVPEGLLLAEVAPGVDIERDVLGQMGFKPIIPGDVASMNPAIFHEGPMGGLGRH